MKKILISILVVSIFSIFSMALLADERPSSYNALPAAAKKFLSQYFKNIDVAYVEEDRDSFDVKLSNGIEVEFKKNGEWEKVESNYKKAIPTGFIPKAVLNSIKKQYPNASIIKIEKDWGGFDIDLDNRMELKVNNNGKIVKAEYDD